MHEDPKASTRVVALETVPLVHFFSSRKIKTDLINRADG
jgi:hypothetical protein